MYPTVEFYATELLSWKNLNNKEPVRKGETDRV